MPLPEPDGSEHADGSSTFTHVSNRHNADSGHADEQPEGKVPLEQSENGQDKRLNDHDFVGDRLDVDVSRGKFDIEHALQFRCGLALDDGFALRGFRATVVVVGRNGIGSDAHVQTRHLAGELCFNDVAVHPHARGKDVGGLLEKASNRNVSRVFGVCEIN